MLQADWSMRRLRPNSVSTGTTDMQFDCVEQSPQFSQTRALMKARMAGSGIGPALAAAALFGGAGLVVNERGDGRNVAQGALDRQQVAAVAHIDLARQIDAGIFSWFVGDHDHARDALGQQLTRDHRDRERALDPLAAGHGDRVIVKDLVGDRPARRHGGADRQQARVLIGAVAKIGEDMLCAW